MQKDLKEEVKKNPSKVLGAFKMYEQVFITYKNSKLHEANENPVGHPDRVEHDLNDIEKSHLDLLKSKLEMEIALEAKESSEKLGDKVHSLNRALLYLTIIMALSAFASAVADWWPKS